MSADLLDDFFIEMARVAEEATSKVECVLQAIKGLILECELVAFLHTLGLDGGVNVLDPVLVS